MSNMTELLPVVIISMILAVASHKRSRYNYILERYNRKDALFYTAMIIVMVLFVGLRRSYNDTITYVQGYQMTPAKGNIFQGVKEWSLGSNPGFNFINVILRHLGASRQTFLMFYAVITLSLYLWFLRKYSSNIWLSVFLLIVTGCFTFTLAAIKQCLAIALCLVATDFALRKKWVWFVFFVLLATTFHPYALMYFCVPFLTFRPWTFKTYIILVVFALIGVLLEVLLDSLLSITTMMGEEYNTESFSGEGVNPFRLAVCAVPMLVSFVAQKRILSISKDDKPEFFLFLNLTILNAEIMFVALFGTANYFARLANYFLYFQALSIPWLLQMFDRQSRRILSFFAVVCYSLYFYYENAVDKIFNADYSCITLIDYIKELLRGTF